MRILICVGSSAHIRIWASEEGELMRYDLKYFFICEGGPQKIFHLKAVFVGFPLIHGRVSYVHYACNERKNHVDLVQIWCRVSEVKVFFFNSHIYFWI